MRNRYGGEELYSNPTIVSNLQMIQKVVDNDKDNNVSVNQSASFS